MKKQYIDLSKHYRASVVKWSDSEYSLQLQYNAWPCFCKNWEEYEVEREETVTSEMQVYGLLEEWRREVIML